MKVEICIPLTCLGILGPVYPTTTNGDSAVARAVSPTIQLKLKLSRHKRGIRETRAYLSYGKLI